MGYLQQMVRKVMQENYRMAQTLFTQQVVMADSMNLSSIPVCQIISGGSYSFGVIRAEMDRNSIVVQSGFLDASSEPHETCYLQKTENRWVGICRGFYQSNMMGYQLIFAPSLEAFLNSMCSDEYLQIVGRAP